MSAAETPRDARGYALKVGDVVVHSSVGKSASRGIGRVARLAGRTKVELADYEPIRGKASYIVTPWGPVDAATVVAVEKLPEVAE